ncbi:MAG: MFS transporter [Candidatus Heimdallarchaeota archaeon]
MTRIESQENPSQKPKGKLKWEKFRKYYLVIFILFLVMFTMRSTVTMLQVFVPELSNEFSKSTGKILLAFTIYNLSTAFFSLILGALTEKIGYKVMITTGMLIFAGATCFTAFAINYWMLVVGQIVAGLGGAMFGPANIAYAGDFLPKEKKASAIGVIMSSFYVSNILAVPINTLAGDILGWQWSVGIMAIFSGVIFIMILLLLPKLKRSKEINLLDDSINNTNEEIHCNSLDNENMSYWGRIKLVFTNKYAVGTFFITLFQRGGLIAMTSLLTKWLQVEHGLSRTDAGLFFLGAGLAALVSNTLFSWVADKIGKRIIIIVGTILTMIWIGIFPIFSTTVPLAVTSIIILNFLAAISMGSYNTFVTDVEINAKGTATSMNNTFGQLSIAGSIALFGFIYDLTDSYIYCGAMGIFAIAVILMFIFVRPKAIEQYHIDKQVNSQNKGT